MRDRHASLRALGFVVSLPLVACFTYVCRGADDAPRADIVLTGGRVIDGSNTPAFRADVAIADDRIVAVGTFPLDDKAVKIDVSGLIVAPGFIDLHTHSDATLVKPKTRSNLNYLMQGATTVVTGNCGFGPASIAEYFRTIERQGVGTNVIHLIPHGTVRATVLGNDPHRPTEIDLARMTELVDRGMREGAWGMSTGLIYIPGMYARTDELIALAAKVSEHGGIYATHMRNEEEKLLDSIDEAIAIGRKAHISVHISHLKANLKPNWGKVAEACGLIEKARDSGMKVTADQYPYAASSTKLGAMVVPDWALRGGASEFRSLSSDPTTRRRLIEAIEAELAKREGGAALRIARYTPRPDWNGLDLVAIAQRERKTPVAIVIEIERNGDAQAISFGMADDDVKYVMKKLYVVTASDGAAHSPDSGDMPHPRSYGTFPRKIRFAVDDEVLTLEQAIYSASGLPASILGLTDRGLVRAGAFADVIVFDPAKFRDAATFEKPAVYAEGINHVFVNGMHAIKNGKYMNTLAGRVLRHGEKSREK